MNDRGRRVYIVATVTLVLAWWAGNQYVAHMDDRFFQLSQPGIQGLALYLIGDYSGAAEAYRAHLSVIRVLGRVGREACASFGLEYPEAAEREVLRFYEREWPR